MSTTELKPETSRDLLWCVNIDGPDDIIAAPDYLTAVKMANAFNSWWLDLKTGEPLHVYDPRMWAFPVEWPHSNGHAEDLSRTNGEYKWLIERAKMVSPEPVAVKVKALEWTQKAPPVHDHEPFVYWAAGIGGHYRAERDGVLWYAHDAFHWEQFGSQKEAKAAAQADHNARSFANIELAPVKAPVAGDTFQGRVQAWMTTCFGPEISADRIERNHRFIEEALELVQANGCTQSEAHQLVDYVYGRPAGDPRQEVGGVMVTLAALCLASGFDMSVDGEKELARVWTKVDAIRAKQAAKPKHSPLPAALVAGESAKLRKIISDCATALGNGAHISPDCSIDFMSGLPNEIKLHLAALQTAPTSLDVAMSQAAIDVLAERRRQIEVEGWTPEQDDVHSRGEMATAAGCYILHETHLGNETHLFWPWEMSWFKPTNRRRDLVKAGALILAEIERFDRDAARELLGRR